MKTLFVRDPQTNWVIPELIPGLEWVLEGQGTWTIFPEEPYYLLPDGTIYRRHEVMAEKDGSYHFPAGYWEIERDDQTRRSEGWLPVKSCPEILFSWGEIWPLTVEELYQRLRKEKGFKIWKDGCLQADIYQSDFPLEEAEHVEEE